MSTGSGLEGLELHLTLAFLRCCLIQISHFAEDDTSQTGKGTNNSTVQGPENKQKKLDLTETGDLLFNLSSRMARTPHVHEQDSACI